MGYNLGVSLSTREIPRMAVLTASLLLVLTVLTSSTHAATIYLKTGQTAWSGSCSGCSESSPCSLSGTATTLASGCDIVFLGPYTITDHTISYSGSDPVTVASTGGVSSTTQFVLNMASADITIRNFQGTSLALPRVVAKTLRIEGSTLSITNNGEFSISGASSIIIQSSTIQNTTTTTTNLIGISFGSVTNGAIQVISSTLRAGNNPINLTPATVTQASLTVTSSTIYGDRLWNGSPFTTTTISNSELFLYRALSQTGTGAFNNVIISGSNVTCTKALVCQLFSAFTGEISATSLTFQSSNFYNFELGFPTSGARRMQIDSTLIEDCNINTLDYFFGSIISSNRNQSITVKRSTFTGNNATPLLTMGTLTNWLTFVDMSESVSFTNSGGCDISVYTDVSFLTKAGDIKPASFNSLCVASSTSTMGGGLVTVKTAIGKSSTDTTVTLKPKFLHLHSVTVNSVALLIPWPDTLKYEPTIPNQGITLTGTGSRMDSSFLEIIWPHSYLPTPGVAYPFSSNTNSSMQLVPSVDYDISLSYTAVGQKTSFTFNTVPCPTQCPPSHISGQCVKRDFCTCVAPWSGPYCECNTTGIPTNVYCDPNGGAHWISDVSIIIPSSSTLELPTGHSLTITGNLVLNGKAIVPDGAIVAVSGQTTVNANLAVNSKLLEEEVSSEYCGVYSNVQFISNSFQFGSSSSVNLRLDAADLTSCTPPPTGNAWYSSIVAATFASSSNTIISTSSAWSVTFLGTPNQFTAFTLKLLRSSSTGTSTGTSQLSSSGASCIVKQQSAGTASLVVGCAAPAQPPVVPPPVTSPPVQTPPVSSPVSAPSLVTPPTPTPVASPPTTAPIAVPYAQPPSSPSAAPSSTPAPYSPSSSPTSEPVSSPVASPSAPSSPAEPTPGASPEFVSPPSIDEPSDSPSFEPGAPYEPNTPQGGEVPPTGNSAVVPSKAGVRWYAYGIPLIIVGVLLIAGVVILILFIQKLLCFAK